MRQPWKLAVVHIPTLWCQTNLGYSYSPSNCCCNVLTIQNYVPFVVKVCGEFFIEPNGSTHEVRGRFISPCVSIATRLHPPTTQLTHAHNMHYTPTTTHPTAFHSPPLPTTNKHKACLCKWWQNGTRRRDGVKVLWCHSHLVWLVFLMVLFLHALVFIQKIF